MTPEDIVNRYQQRIQQALTTLQRRLQKAGYPCGPIDFREENYSWVFSCEILDVTFQLCQSELWSGEKNGVNFSVTLNDKNGKVIGSVIPYNYTPAVWVDRNKPNEVEERFQLVETATANVNVDELLKSL